MTGATLRTLREALELTRSEFARELGITLKAVEDAEQVKKMKPATEQRYVSALERVVTRRRAERLRQQMSHLLELAAVTDSADLTTIR